MFAYVNNAKYVILVIFVINRVVILLHSHNNNTIAITNNVTSI